MSLGNTALILAKILLTFGGLNAADPQVCMQNLGCVQGAYMPGYNTEKFEAFLGIPFAEPPIGALRFKNPVPIKPWKSVLSATVAKSDCIQKNYILDGWPVGGEENCLYLNVYRPSAPSTATLPVILYFYGGGFFCGTANPGQMDPAYFMDTQEVIVVTTNYRLGAFGFLSTGSVEMPGNLGLKDQQMALKFLHANIAEFGGDPEAITLVGHSVGAASARLHMLSANSQEFFRSLITASGNAMGSYVAYIREPREQALKIAKAVNIKNAENLSNQALLELLQTVDAHSLLNAGDSLKMWQQFPLFNFRPTIESAEWPDAFLTEAPIEIIKNGKAKGKPWLHSVVNSQGEGAVWSLLVWTHAQLLQEFNENFDEHLWQLMDLSINVDAERQHEIITMLVDEYLQGARVLNNETLKGFSELFGDLGFHYPFWLSVQNYVKIATPNNPLYLMLYNYHGPNTHASFYAGGKPYDFGVVHMDDAAYLFRAPLTHEQVYAKNSTDERLMREMVAFYVDFAKNGNVRGIDACSEANLQANAVSGICDYLEISKSVDKGYEKIVHNDFKLKRMQLWHSILNE